MQGGGMKIDAEEEVGNAEVGSADFKRGEVFFVVGTSHYFQRDRDGPFLAEAHEDNVRSEGVHPGGKCGFAAEGMKLAEKLQEGLLRQIFGLDGVATHPQA